MVSTRPPAARRRMAGQGRALKGMRWAAVSFVAAVLSGCSGFDALPEADTSAPARFVDAPRQPQPAVSHHWTSGFGSTELDRLVATAEAGNLDIAVAAARIAEAEAQAGEAGAALYPTLSGTANTSTARTPGTMKTTTAPFTATTSRQYSLGLTASYTFDLWGKTAATREAARQGAIEAQFQRDVTILATTASVASTYFQILSAQDRLRIARNNVASAERILAAIRARLSVGTATALDVAQEESVVASQKAAIPALEQSVAQGRSTLAVLLGLAPEQLTVTGGSLGRLKAPAVQPGLPSQLLLRRPDVASAEAGLKAGKANVEAARAAFFPSVTLSGNAGVESIALKTLLSPDAAFYSLAAGLAQPIFDGYQLESNLAFQSSKYAELLGTYRKAIISAFSDVDTALAAVRWTREHEVLQADVVRASRRAYMITEQRLKEGTIDIVTVLQTQSTLFQAEDQLVQVRLQRFQALVSLYQALGGGWSREDLAARPPGDRQ